MPTESEVSIMLLVSYVQLVTQQDESRTVKKHLCNQSSHYEKMDNFRYAKNQELFEEHLCSNYEKYRRFLFCK